MHRRTSASKRRNPSSDGIRSLSIVIGAIPEEHWRMCVLVGLEGCNDELWFIFLAREWEANQTADDRGVSDMDLLDGICFPSG